MEEKINEVLDNFDFSSVHNAMTLLGLEWATLDNNYEIKTSEVPSLPRIIRCASRLLEDVSKIELGNSEFAVLSTGGFEAYKYADGGLELKFVIETYETV